ncbi:hypothetical protein JNO63_03760 [Anaerococcus sp. mt242]|uniref:hypothetical protein n=1 Tax=Anaerococcus sp. mt242 TaxID=2661917 RepID=UPI001931581A|nr:hypothetical protein [Anaerococcus sp. mt242]MBM0046203.1 hypothetical protein [Anaerococcus sp. mt242]
MLSKILSIIMIVFLLSSCSNETNEKSIENKNNQEDTSQKIDDKKNKKAQKVTIIPNKKDAQNPKLEVLQFDDKSTEDIISFFEKFNIKFEKNDEIVDGVIEDQDGNLVDINKYDEKKFPDSPSTAWYVYKKKLNTLTTPIDDSNTSNLELHSLDTNGNIQENILLDNINYLEPLFVYDNNKLYYSSDTMDGKSVLGMINLDDYSFSNLKEYDFTKKDNKYKGDIITLISKQDDQIVYQLSTYNNQYFREDKPHANKLIYLSNPSKIVDIGDSNYDYIEKLGSYIICHHKPFNEDEELLEIYDDNFNLLYSLKDNPIERLIDLTILNKDNKDYLLIKDGLGTHYIIDLEDNNENYQLNNISTVGRDLSIIADKLVISTTDSTYIGYKNK